MCTKYKKRYKILIFIDKNTIFDVFMVKYCLYIAYLCIINRE